MPTGGKNLYGKGVKCIDFFTRICYTIRCKKEYYADGKEGKAAFAVFILDLKGKK